LKNLGTAPAEDVRVFIKFPADLTVGTHSELFALPREPKPPDKPKPRDNFSFYRPSVFIPTVPNFRKMLKPESLVWHGIDKVHSGWIASFEVKKLNHGYSAHCPRILHLVFPSVDSMRSFHVEYEITAGNLPNKSDGLLHGVLMSTQ
jgi:hypothetical protein